jgi:DNA-binding Lrp family transcriptional regulator
MLSIFEKRLCNILQEGLPVCHRPFGEIANKLKTDEQKVLRQIKILQRLRVIRNLRAIIDYNALGFTSTLAAAHIEQENLNEAAKAVNSLEGVSHNYTRNHYYNLWFTLRAKSQREIGNILRSLSRKFGTDFYSMPVERSFKLDVCFDVLSGGRSLLNRKERKISSKSVKLNQVEKKILEGMQGGIKITEKPFDFLCSSKLKIEDVLKIIQGLIDKGVIRRIAASVDYKKLGFRANLLFACKVEERRIVRVGGELAKLAIVSHCYQRKSFAGFDYNLFAMCHGRSVRFLNSNLKRFAEKQGLKNFAVLSTVKSLKRK